MDSQRWRHQPKNLSERSKLVFHVPMLIERIKSKGEDTVRWVIRLWNRSLKIFKFWLNKVTSSIQNLLKKGPKLVSHVLMVIQIYKCIYFCRVFTYILIPRGHSLQDILGTFAIRLYKRGLNFEFFKKLLSQKHFF